MRSQNGSKIALGDIVRDRITGFEGVAVCLTFWLYNCVRVGVQPTKLHEGKTIAIETFDEDSLKIVGSIETVSSAPTGGPRNDAAAQRR